MSKRLPYKKNSMPDVVCAKQIIDGRLVKGIELFNKKDYYDCHEVIEDLWLETPKDDPYRDFYKGIIQAAAAIYQYERGILSGAQGLYKSCVKYLGKFENNILGIDVTQLIHNLDVYFMGAFAGPAGLLRPQKASRNWRSLRFLGDPRPPSPASAKKSNRVFIKTDWN